MKNLLFILTVLLCTVSCSKEKEEVKPTFDWNTQINSCRNYKTTTNKYYYFNSSSSLKVTDGNNTYTGNYNIVSVNEIYISYYTGYQGIPVESYTYKNCYKTNNAIYSNSNLILTEVK